MKNLSCTLLLIFLSFFAFAQEDAPGCKDSPLFNRMPHTEISECTSDFDLMEIPMSADRTESKEGNKTSIAYNYFRDESTAPSFYQIVKNYENALLKNGGKRVYYSSEGGVATLSGKVGGKEIWVVLHDAGGIKKGNFQLTILEMEAMKQEITAGEMLTELNSKGSVALYINFETGKATVKPESQAIIDQVAKLLSENPALKISVEGHTDNAGTPQANQILSDSRAKAVTNALIAKGINKTRLASKGWGQTKPLAGNTSEAGRARNRRVEIVKI